MPKMQLTKKFVWENWKNLQYQKDIAISTKRYTIKLIQITTLFWNIVKSKTIFVIQNTKFGFQIDVLDIYKIQLNLMLVELLFAIVNNIRKSLNCDILICMNMYYWFSKLLKFY